MNRNALILGAVGLGGLFIYARSKGLTLGITSHAKAAPPANSMGATGNQGNASQPWYKQATGFLQSEANQQIKNVQSNPTAALQNFGSVVHSLSDFSGISSWFGGGDQSAPSQVNPPASPPPDTISSPDDTSSMDSADLPAMEIDQSNAIGDLTDPNLTYDPSVDFSDSGFDPNSGDNFGSIGDSNSDFNAA